MNSLKEIKEIESLIRTNQQIDNELFRPKFN